MVHISTIEIELYTCSVQLKNMCIGKAFTLWLQHSPNTRTQRITDLTAFCACYQIADSHWPHLWSGLMNTRRKEGRMKGPAQISDNPSFKHALLQSLSVEVANPVEVVQLLSRVYRWFSFVKGRNIMFIKKNSTDLRKKMSTLVCVLS